jgi:hypothetical protein
MAAMIVFCGLDCAQCEAYQATQANDQAWQERVLAKWRTEFHMPDMPFAAVVCDGCRGARLGGYCGECPIRACAVSKGFETCADCPDYACPELEKILSMAPQNKANLEALRAHRNN